MAKHKLELALESVEAIENAHVGNVGFVELIASGSGKGVMGAKPSAFDAVLEGGLKDAVAGDLAHVGRGQPPNGFGNAVLLDQGLSTVVELKGVVGGEGNVESDLKVRVKRVLLVAQEERVVAEGRHCKTDLMQVVEVLKSRSLLESDAVVDSMCCEKACGEMADVSCLSRVWTKGKRVEAAGLAQVVEVVEIDKQEEEVIRVRWIRLENPFGGLGAVQVELRLKNALVINSVKGHDVQEEIKENGIGFRVEGDLKERLEDGAHHIAKAGNTRSLV